jgi:hypothetical protein
MTPDRTPIAGRMSEGDLHTYVEHLRQSVPECVHPSGAIRIHHWLGDMCQMACIGDLTTFYTLAHKIKATIDRELRWHQESLASASRRPPAKTRWGP